jgi:Type IV secretion system pilin
MRRIVAWWSVFSGPRRSNFPKSLLPGTIERPVPFDWIVTRTIMKVASMRSMIWSACIILQKKISATSYKKKAILQIFGFFHIFCYYEQSYTTMNKLFNIIFIAIFWGIFSSVVFGDQNVISDKDFMISLWDLDPVNPTGTDVPRWTRAITMLLEKIANFLLFIIPIVAGVSLIIAGYFYILSWGDSEKATKAKTIIKWNAIAIVIALTSYAIIATIASILDGTI